VHPRGDFYQTDFPPPSCSVLRGPALLRPHPGGTPAGLAPAWLLPQEVLPGRLPEKISASCLRGLHTFNFVVADPIKKQACESNEARGLGPRHRHRARPVQAQANEPLRCTTSRSFRCATFLHTQKPLSRSTNRKRLHSFTAARDTRPALFLNSPRRAPSLNRPNPGSYILHPSTLPYSSAGG
jgi:hypothetical protein